MFELQPVEAFDPAMCAGLNEEMLLGFSDAIKIEAPAANVFEAGREGDLNRRITVRDQELSADMAGEWSVSALGKEDCRQNCSHSKAQRHPFLDV